MSKATVYQSRSSNEMGSTVAHQTHDRAEDAFRVLARQGITRCGIAPRDKWPTDCAESRRSRNRTPDLMSALQECRARRHGSCEVVHLHERRESPHTVQWPRAITNERLWWKACQTQGLVQPQPTRDVRAAIAKVHDWSGPLRTCGIRVYLPDSLRKLMAQSREYEKVRGLVNMPCSNRA